MLSVAKSPLRGVMLNVIMVSFVMLSVVAHSTGLLETFL
jgi:hypothetical protein